MEKPESTKKQTENSAAKGLKTWSLAWELGYMIAVPIILFALLGRFVDENFHTSPLFLLLAILLSLILTGFLIWKKIKTDIE